VTAAYLTPPEIAKRLRVKPSKVVGWITSGEQVGFNVASRRATHPRWRVTPDHLHAFLAARSSRKPAPVVRRRRAAPPLVDYFPPSKHAKVSG
jgi:hypothetical protein